MFRPLPGHNQAFLRIKSINTATCTQHLSTLFVRRPVDGPVRAETCSLIYNKYDVLDVNGFSIILVY